MADVFLHRHIPAAGETPLAPSRFRRGLVWLKGHGMEAFIAAVIVAGLFGPWIVSVLLLAICGLCWLMPAPRR